jgi:mannose-1-phosphate guanylyltransferase
MKAMILAAGLGTRLRPLTNDRPKALVEVAGRTLLELSICRLRSFGIRELIINVHHFADLVIAYLKANDNFGIRIEVSREDELLDTGGGLQKAAWFFLEDAQSAAEPFLLHNVDVISTIDLARLVEDHRKTEALATLAVQDRPTSRPLLFDDQLQLCGRRTPPDGKTELVRSSSSLVALAFSGIQVISPRLLATMHEDGAFSIINTYLQAAARREKVLGFRADEYYWRDLGRPDNVNQAAQDLKHGIILQ